MSINATNRIINRKYLIMQQVKEYEENKARRQRRNFKNIHVQVSTCSQCKRSMRRDLADAQIENKRENAPICMACIMGYTRTNLEDKIERFKKSSNYPKFQEYIKRTNSTYSPKKINENY